VRDPVRVRCHDVSRGGGHHPAPPVGQVTRGRGRRRLGRIPTSAGVDGPDQPQRAGTCGLEPTPERTGGRTRRSSTPSKRRPTARLGLRHAHRVACSRPAGYRRPLRSTSVGFRPAAVGTRVITGDPQRAAVPVRRPERRARRPVGSRHRVRRQRVHRRFQWPGSEGRHGVQTRRVSVGCIRHRRGGAAHLVEGAALTAWSGCDGRWLAGIGLDRELTVRRSPFRRSGSGGSAGAGWLPVAIPKPITADCRLESVEGSGPTPLGRGGPSRPDPAAGQPGCRGSVGHHRRPPAATRQGRATRDRHRRAFVAGPSTNRRRVRGVHSSAPGPARVVPLAMGGAPDTASRVTGMSW